MKHGAATYGGQMENTLTGFGQLNETRQETVRGGHGQFESQNFQNQMLHTQHLLLRVRIVRNVDELGHFRGVNLFVFPKNRTRSSTRVSITETWRNVGNLRGDEHGCRSHQLQFPAQNRHVRQESVNERNRQKQRLVMNFILLGHLHQPINEDWSHSGSDIRLFPHVVRFRSMTCLEATHTLSFYSNIIQCHFLAHLTISQILVNVSKIDLWQCWLKMLIIFSQRGVLLVFLMSRFINNHRTQFLK